MDITILRTFLEVSATGSFRTAAARLFVTQSAVSLRIQKLEEQLGTPLFTRSKAGAELTPAGREFERYTLSILKLWEEAKQLVAIPEGYDASLTIGGQYSLWPRLGFRWIDAIRAALPRVSVRAELGNAEALARSLSEGVVQAALVYVPRLNQGLSTAHVMDDELIMVAAWPEATMEQVRDRYVLMDWGSAFIQAHALHLPELTQSGLVLSLGAIGADFIRNRGLAGYLPLRYVKRFIDEGSLCPVIDAPTFPYPVWVVWRDDLPGELKDVALQQLSQVAENLGGEAAELVDSIKKTRGGEAMERLGEPDLTGYFEKSS